MIPDAIPMLQPEQTALLQSLIARECGIQVDDRKLEIVMRLAWHTLAAAGIDGVPALIMRLAAAEDRAWQALIPFLTTNETYFLREAGQLKDFADVALPALRSAMLARGGAALRVLSAGCSSGEEAYTLAALLDEAGVSARIVGIDLDPEMILKARGARYGRASFRGVPDGWREARFLPVEGAQWEVLPRLRAAASFEQANLLALGEHLAGQRFDAIFCRNVLIYFSRTHQLEVIRQLKDLLMPGGYLLLGHSEMFLDADLGLEVHRSRRSTMYQRGPA